MRGIALDRVFVTEDRLPPTTTTSAQARPKGQASLRWRAMAPATTDFLNVFVNQYNSMGHEGVFLSARDPVALAEAGFVIESDTVHKYMWRFGSQQQMLEDCRGLFGVDLADDGVLLAGIKQYLAPQFAKHNASRQLRYIIAFPAKAIQEQAAHVS